MILESKTEMSISTPHDINHGTTSVMPLNSFVAEDLGTEHNNMTSDISDITTWHSLRGVIAASSGFKTWSDSRAVDTIDRNLDELVRRYLRETLETLAY